MLPSLAALLDELGIRLISVRENFGEGIQAEAMEAITDIMNQMGNQLSGEDIRLKLRNKAMNGGTLGPARIGYLNIRKEVDGYLVNSIGVDPKRAPLVRQAFELYATGQYTHDRLHSELEDRGLRTRATPTRPSSPLSRSRLNGILKDPYYTGVVIYKGEVFPGRHEPIIPQDLFERVQEVMSERSGAGSREVTHLHYLRGILRCQRCHDRNIESRLLFTESKGRNGDKHQYYFCATRQRDKSCDLPFLPVWEVEDKIAPVFDEIAISEVFVADLNDKLDDALRAEHESVRESRLQLNKELASIVKRESRLIDAITEGLVTHDMAKAKMNELAVKKQGISRRLDKTVALLQQGVDVLRDLASLMLSPREHYEKAPDSYRRLALQTYFTVVRIDDKGEYHPAVREPFASIRKANDAFTFPQPVAKDPVSAIASDACPAANDVPMNMNHTESPESAQIGDSGRLNSMSGNEESDAELSTPPLLSSLIHTYTNSGSSKYELVGSDGLEPTTKGL